MVSMIFAVDLITASKSTKLSKAENYSAMLFLTRSVILDRFHVMQSSCLTVQRKLRLQKQILKIESLKFDIQFFQAVVYLLPLCTLSCVYVLHLSEGFKRQRRLKEYIAKCIYVYSKLCTIFIPLLILKLVIDENCIF